MHPSDIARAYDELAPQWTAPGFNRENGIEAHRRALQFLRDGRTALDAGCGASGRFIDLLLAHGFAVEGLDISPRTLELARERHPNVPFHLADLCEWVPPRRYDFITAWDSAWHVPMAAQESVTRKLLRALEPGGVLLLTSGGLDEPTEKTDDAMGPAVSYSVLGIPRLLATIDSEDAVCRHLEYDQWPELHLYAIAQRRGERG